MPPLNHPKKNMVCRGRAPTLSPKRTPATMCNPTIAMVSAAAVPPPLTKLTTVVSINGYKAKALVDSGSSESFIHPKLTESASLSVHPTTSTISMATSSLEAKVNVFCLVDLELEGRQYRNLHLSVLPERCADLILVIDFRSQHKSVIF